MALQFNGYGGDPGAETRKRWGGTLDDILNQYQAAKQQALAERDRQSGALLQYGFDPRQVTPDIIRQAQGPAPAAPQAAIPAPAQAGSMIAPQGPQQFMAGLQAQPLGGQAPFSPAPNGQAEIRTPEEHPIVGHVRAFMQKRDQASALSTRGKIADIRKDEADAGLKETLAGTKPHVETYGGDKYLVHPGSSAMEYSRQPDDANAGKGRQTQLDNLGKDLDYSQARAGQFGVSGQIFNRAERLSSLATAIPDGNLDSRQIEELAVGLNAMLSGSNTGAQEQVKALVPHSVMGNAQKLKEWLVNEPQGTNQQEFVKRMLGSIEREKATASDQIKRVQYQRLSKHEGLRKADGANWESVVRSYGVDPNEYDAWKKGGYKKIDATQGPEGGGKHDALLDKYGAP